jgi:hypothetical protein
MQSFFVGIFSAWLGSIEPRPTIFHDDVHDVIHTRTRAGGVNLHNSR